MLNRRILRIKAFKSVFSLAENPDISLKEARTQLSASCEATRDLYLFMLALVKPLTDEARSRIEAVKSRFNPSEADLNPNMKFVNNALAPLLDGDPDFGKIIKKKKLSWDQYDALIRQLYETVREKDYFKDYLASEESSLKEDAGLFIKIYETELEDNRDLSEILEDLSIYWNDDLAYALNWCCRTFAELGKGGSWQLPELYMSDITKSSESDREFLDGVVARAYAGYDKYYSMVAENCRKWDKDRICVTDLALIVCGLAEADAFPKIGFKTIINEYVEISKFYSTPESSAFVNGLLDRLINKNN